MYNNGRGYEIFVAGLQQALFESEKYSEQKNISIELNKKIVDNCGIEREFDIYWEYELGGITYKTIIECKDYNSNISVEKIDSLIGKIKDIPDLKPVFATKKGYQSGAKTKADQNRVELLVVREQNDSDWEDEHGNPLVKIISINLVAYSPAQITKFIPGIDAEWAEINSDIDLSNPSSFNLLNTDIVIDDLERGEKYSLSELSSKLVGERRDQVGAFSEVINCSNAFIHFNGTCLKLSGYKVEFILSKPIEQTIEIDFSKEIIGVIEYINKGKKKAISKNGSIKDL